MKQAYFVAGGDLLESGLGVCADPQDPRIEIRYVCPKCDQRASVLTRLQALAFYPVVAIKFPNFSWEIAPVKEQEWAGMYWIRGWEYDKYSSDREL